MKKKMTLFLVLEAVLCAAYVLPGQALPNLFGTLVTFPFKQIGLGLRALSLSGGAGNVTAIVLYIAVCLVPMAVLLRKKAWQWEDSLLVVLTAALFPVMYLMVNPHLQGEWLGQMQATLGTEIMGAVIWSIIAGYLVLRLLRKCFAAEEHRLMDYLRGLMAVLAAAFVLGAFGTGLDGLLGSIESVRSGNSVGNLNTTYFFLGLQYLVDILPNILCCGIIQDAHDMLGNMKEEPYSDEVIAAAEELSRSCGMLLTAVVVSNAAFNLLQLLNMKRLHVVNAVVQLPLDVVVLVIALLLMARFIRSHKQLKEENDFFI